VDSFKYKGNELIVFSRAVNWKSYWMNAVAPHLKGCVLEVGAGIGENTKRLIDLTEGEWVCLEPDLELCKEISKWGSKSAHCGRLKVLNSLLSDLPLSMDFDTILYIDVLEHIEQDDEELRSAIVRLRPNGKIIVLSPAHNFLYSAFDNKIGHFRRYDRKMIEEILPTGVVLSEFRYLDSIGFFASLVNKFFLRTSDPSPEQVLFWDRYMVRASVMIDKRIGYKFGKSLLGVLVKNKDNTVELHPKLTHLAG